MGAGLEYGIWGKCPTPYPLSFYILTEIYLDSSFIRKLAKVPALSCKLGRVPYDRAHGWLCSI